MSLNAVLRFAAGTLADRRQGLGSFPGTRCM